METDSKTKPRVRRAIVTLVTAGSLIAAPAAMAAGDSPSDAQYNSTLTEISAGGSHEPTATSAGGSLPFTGLDVGAMAAVAAGLGLAGFAMRRRLQATNDDRSS